MISRRVERVIQLYKVKGRTQKPQKWYCFHLWYIVSQRQWPSWYIIKGRHLKMGWKSLTIFQNESNSVSHSLCWVNCIHWFSERARIERWWLHKACRDKRNGCIDHAYNYGILRSSKKTKGHHHRLWARYLRSNLLGHCPSFSLHSILNWVVSSYCCNTRDAAASKYLNMVKLESCNGNNGVSQSSFVTT